MNSPEEGIILDTMMTESPNTCIIHFRVSANRAMDTVSVFFNHASVLTSTETWDPVFLTFLFYFYERDTYRLSTFSEITISNTSRQIKRQQFDSTTLPTGVSTFYLTLRANESQYKSFRLRFSVTITPVYRCALVRTSKPQITSTVEQNFRLEYYVFYQQGYIPCQELHPLDEKLYTLCIPRGLLCDTHTNCPVINERSLDEPHDVRLCQTPKLLRKVDLELVLGVLAVILVLLMIFAMVFTISDYKLWCKRIRGGCARRRENSFDERSIGTEFSLPIAPPRYESAEDMNLRQAAICKLCSPQSPAPLAYESPPSYTRDMEDETGVYPTFIRPIHTRRRPRSSSAIGSRRPVFRRRRTTTTDAFTEDTRSTESWAMSYLHTHGMDSSTDLPSYRDIAPHLAFDQRPSTHSDRR
ncbi:unnamed protein product [Echinostoma caproni]|uniref:CUB domain-containing protein n=1 Tax=Echinostoma caproni TaxID=27848 RepID=A0A183ACX1_9TREM|nr:unnamed protein product [Echinostoma caproni]